MTKKAAISAKKTATPAWKNHAEAMMAIGLIGPLVEAFLAAHGEKWSPTRLGREALKDPNRIFLLRDGQLPKAATCEKILGVIEGAAPGFVIKYVRRHLRGATP